MLYEAQLISKSFEEDPQNMGFILVRFDRKVRWARPKFVFGEVKIPTKEWIEQYASPNKIGVYVQEVDNQPYLVWDGFIIYKNNLPAEAMANYAYRRVHLFSESWKIYSDDKQGEQKYVIEHTDGSKISIDRSGSNKTITIEDGVYKNILLMDREGVQINGQFVVLGPFIDWLQKYQASFGLGNLGIPVPISPAAIAELTAKLLIPNEMKSKNTP